MRSLRRGHAELDDKLKDYYAQLAERLERMAYELRQRSTLNVIDLLEAAQFIRDHLNEATTV